MTTAATPDAPAASSAANQSTAQPAATEARSGQERLDSLTPEQRSAYELTGDLPDAEAPAGDSANKSVEKAESTTAKPAEQAAPNQTGAKTEEASSSSAPQKDEKDPYKEKTERRFQEILTKVSDLQRENEDLRRGGTKAPEPKEVTLESVIESPDVSKGPIGEGDFFMQFPSAGVGDYARYVTAHALKANDVRAAHHDGVRRQFDAINTRGEAFHSKISEAVKADATLQAKMSERVTSLAPLDAVMAGKILGQIPHDYEPTGANILAQELVMSENPIPLMLHFSENPADLDRIAALPNTVAIVREMAKLEARLSSSAAAGGAVPAPKTVSNAPAPPPTVGSKPAAPADEIQAAVASNDFERYAQEANRREMAARKK
jgi:hypothetical protein